MIRKAYEEAARAFVELVGTIRPDEWERPGLPPWNVRVLVGHASRGLTLVTEYLDRGARPIELERTIDYYVALDRSGTLSMESLTQRAEESADALGDDPAAALRAIRARVMARLANAPDDAPVATAFGTLRLIDYLPTRVMELGVHTLDLAAALGRPLALPRATANAILHLVADMAMYPGRAEPLILAATGRAPLPDGYSVIF